MSFEYFNHFQKFLVFYSVLTRSWVLNSAFKITSCPKYEIEIFFNALLDVITWIQKSKMSISMIIFSSGRKIDICIEPENPHVILTIINLFSLRTWRKRTSFINIRLTFHQGSLLYIVFEKRTCLMHKRIHKGPLYL